MRCYLSPRRGLFALARVLLAASSASAQLPTPQLTSIFPAGAKAGAQVEVTVCGANLDETEQFLFSHPGITAAPKMGAAAGGKPAKAIESLFTVSVAGDVPPGVYEARVKGRFGVSNPRSFVVGTLSEVLEDPTNSSAAKAQAIVIGSVVNGRADANNRDYYKLALKTGDRILVDCRTAAIDSRMAATLALVNPQGREVARSRDNGSQEAVIDYITPAEGTYTLVVYDFLYGGGPEYPYRLAVHQAPRIDFIIPAAGVPGTNAPFTIYGRNLPNGQAAGITLNGAALEKLTVNIPIPADASALALSDSFVAPRMTFLDRFDYRLTGPGGVSNPVGISLAAAPIAPEVEPNSTPDKAQVLNVPCEVAGQFYPARDRDYYQFSAKKGEVWSIEIFSHRLGLESDPALTIQRVTKNDKGEETVTEVAQVDDAQERQNRIGGDFDTSTDDAAYRLVVNEDATYRVIARDNFGESRTDPKYVYRLVVRPEQPDFRLVTFLDPPTTQQDQNKIPLMCPVVRKGGSLELRVTLQRRDNFAGEVNVAVEGLPAGLTCPGAVIGGGTDSASLVFTAADNVASWSGPIKVIGKSTVNGQEVTRVARLGTCVWGTTDRNQSPPAYRISRDLVVSVMDKEMEPAAVVVGEDKVYETSRGGKLEIPIKVTRRNGFNEAIKLTKVNLPQDIQVKEINIAAGAADSKLELQFTQQNTKAGTYTFFLRGETKYKYTRNPDAVKVIETEQAELVALTKTLQDALTASNTAKTNAAKEATDATTAANVAGQNKKTAEDQAKAAGDLAKTAATKAAEAKAALDKDAANQGLIDANNAAQKQSTDAAAAAKAAADKLAEGDKALAATQEKMKATEAAKASAEAAATKAKTDLDAATARKAPLDQRLNQAKQENQPKDMQLLLTSTPIKMRIVESPVKLTLGQNAVTGKQGDKVEVPVSIERLFSFADTVEVSVENANIGGVTVQKVDIPKDQAEGKLVVTLAKDAAVGDHTLTLRCRARFNNVQCDTSIPVALKIEKN